MSPKFVLSSVRAAMLVCLGFLLSGCTHVDSADWARDKWDWARIDGTLGDTLASGSLDKGAILAAWGEPLARRITPQGEQMLWLWKRDVSGPWPQSEEGWELLLSFDDRGYLTDRRWGSYRTPLTVGNVIAVARKVGYSNTAQLLPELGFEGQQHGFATEMTTPFGYRTSLAVLGYTHRERVILRYQNAVRAIAEAASVLENAATVENKSAPSEQEVFQYLTKNIQHQAVPNGSTKGAVQSPAGSIYLDDLVGSGFVWPPSVNAYGPWINSDPTKRPFTWQPIAEDPLALL